MEGQGLDIGRSAVPPRATEMARAGMADRILPPVLWWLFAAIWLPFLFYPVRDLLRLHPATPRLVITLAAIVTFVALYLWLMLHDPFRDGTRSRPDSGIHLAMIALLTALVLFLMVCVWAGDIAALYIGRAFGKRKLAPRLSPGKTWLGSIASIAGSMLAAGIVIAISNALTAHGNTLLHIAQPLWQSLLLAAILNIAAQLGDLLESAIKRGAGFDRAIRRHAGKNHYSGRLL